MVKLFFNSLHNSQSIKITFVHIWNVTYMYFATDVHNIGGFNQRQWEALPPQIFLTLSRFVFTVQTHKIGSVYSHENYQNCCHLMSYFKAKKATNSISAGASPQTPLGEITALAQTPSWPYPRSRSRTSGPRNNLPPQICIPKSANGAQVDWINSLLRQTEAIKDNKYRQTQ